MLSKELEFSINLAFRQARDRRHEFMTVEHLLLALLQQDDGGTASLLAQAAISQRVASTELRRIGARAPFNRSTVQRCPRRKAQPDSGQVPTSTPLAPSRSAYSMKDGGN